MRNSKAVISIGGSKYIYGSNVESKVELFSIIKKHFCNITNSEFAIEQSQKTYLALNDKEVDYKQWRLYEVTHNYDFGNELKLGSHSIMLKYFESILINIEFDEIMTTINQLFIELSDVISTKMQMNQMEYEIYPEITEFNMKQLLKVIEPRLYKNECVADFYDLDYEEKLLLQLDLIERISKENVLKEYLILVDLPIVTENISKRINSHEIKNLHYLVILNHGLKCDYQLIVNLGKKCVDFSNEVSIYNDILMEIETDVDHEQIGELLNNYVMGNRTDKVLKLLNIL